MTARVYVNSPESSIEGIQAANILEVMIHTRRLGPDMSIGKPNLKLPSKHMYIYIYTCIYLDTPI